MGGGGDFREYANGQKINVSENDFDPRSLSAPAPGLYTCIWP